MSRPSGKMVGAALLSLCLLSSLTGCLQTTQTSQPSPNRSQSQITHHTTPPQENQIFSLPNLSWMSSSDGEGFYLPGRNLLEYYDPETQTRIPLCSQSGCSHSGESCEAWLAADCQGFVVYDNSWYVLTTEAGSHAVLWKIDLDTHQRTKLCDMAPKADHQRYYFSSGYVSHGYAYLHLRHQLTWKQQLVEEPSLIRVNLANGSVETLVENVTVTFLGAGTERVLLAIETFAVTPLSEKEYLNQHPDGNYYAYLQTQLAENGSGGVELREYTPDMSSYQVLTKGNVWVSTSLSQCRYGDYTLYAVDDTLYVYNLSTGESRQVAEESVLTNFWFIDGQIIYLVRNKEFFARYTDVMVSTTHTLENESNQQGVVFSSHGECQNYVFGLYDGEECLITKDDFFAERYENVIPIP